MLDGVLARLKGTSGTWGAFLDSTLDRIADAAIFAGLVIWFYTGGHNTLLGAVSLFCLVAGSLVSYAKARAEGLGPALRRGPGRAAGADADRAGRRRRLRPRRAVHSRRGALGARGRPAPSLSGSGWSRYIGSQGSETRAAQPGISRAEGRWPSAGGIRGGRRRRTGWRDGSRRLGWKLVCRVPAGLGTRGSSPRRWHRLAPPGARGRRYWRPTCAGCSGWKSGTDEADCGSCAPCPGPCAPTPATGWRSFRLPVTAHRAASWRACTCPGRTRRHARQPGRPAAG